ncbi:MAG: LysE family transporter [Acidimicrobiales bacterium]
MNHFWLGLASGVPLMIAVGPIAVLLVELGIERGLRRAWPAALGVASADLTFATIAAVSGATLQHALQPYAAAMQIAAAAVLLTLAAVMMRRAVAEIRAYRIDRVASTTPATPATPATPQKRARLAARMMGLTLANPLTIVAFTSLVVATGERASNVGWPLGIAAASALVHVGLVATGSALRRALPPIGPAWFRVAGSLLIVGLATNLVLR